MSFKRFSFVFFLGLSFFALQVLLAPTLGASFSGRSLALIYTPPFFAASIVLLALTYFPEKLGKWMHPRTNLFLAALTLFGSLLGVKFLLEHMSVLNAELIGRSIAGSEPYLFWVMLLLCLPQIFYFLSLVNALETKTTKGVPTILILELVGAGLGIILGGVLLDSFGWGVTSGFIFFSLFVGYFISFQDTQKSWVNIGTPILLLLMSMAAPMLEPQTDLRWAARWALGGETKLGEIEELDRDWNTYSKVQTLFVPTSKGERKVITLGDGSGTAVLSHGEGDALPLSVALTAPLKPKSALVLFAGAGAELFGLYKVAPLMREIVGVELNKTLIDQALKDKEYALPELLKRPGIELVQKDAREYLEQLRSKFDLILFSWSGATTAYMSGAAIHTARFAFTKEALEKAWKNLNPNGFMVILGVSKVNVLLTLLESSHVRPYLSEGTLLLEREKFPGWKGGWDFHFLYLKKGRITPDEENILKDEGKKFGYALAYGPSKIKDGHEDFRNLILSPDTKEELRKINQKTDLVFKPILDDRPFPFDATSRQDFISFQFHYGFVPILLALIVFTLLVFKNEKRQIGIQHGLIFILLGLAGVFLQVFSVYKFMFFLGNPTLALMMSIGLSLLASGLANIFVLKDDFKGEKVIIVSILGVAGWSALHFFMNSFEEDIFLLPTVVRGTLLALLFFPSMLLVSTLFPYLLQLKKKKTGHITRWFCFDSTASALASGLTPLLVESFGITIFFNLGIGTFLGALVFCIVFQEDRLI